MKIIKITYWVSTVLIALMMLMSINMYFLQNQQAVEGFKFLGYPAFFPALLGTAKLLGLFGLFQTKCKTLQEWAYAGFTFTFIGAFWTHLATGTPFVMPLVALAILGVSYFARCKQICKTENK